MSKTAVITISSRIPHEPYYFYKEFLASAKRQGIWPIFINPEKWCGLMSKPNAMLDWITKNGEYYDHIIFCDAWDIIWVGDPAEVVRKFEAFKVPLVFNAERNCFPRADLAEQFNASSTPYRFLNSGFIVGTPAGFLDCLNEMHLDRLGVDSQNADGSWKNLNDQEFFSLWYLANQTKAKLDHHAELCQTLHGATDDEFVWDEPIQRVRSKETGTCPVVFHGNGGGKDWLKKIMGWLKL